METERMTARRRGRAGKRQLPPAEIRKGKNENQWSVSEQCKERVGLSSFVNTTTASVCFGLFFTSKIASSNQRMRNLLLFLLLLFRESQFFFLLLWLVKEEEKKEGDLLPFGSTHVWTCFQRLDLISGWSFFLFLSLSCLLYVHNIVVCAWSFFVSFSPSKKSLFILDNDISNSIIIITQQWIISFQLLMIQGKKNNIAKTRLFASHVQRD